MSRFQPRYYETSRAERKQNPDRRVGWEVVSTISGVSCDVDYAEQDFKAEIINGSKN